MRSRSRAAERKAAIVVVILDNCSMRSIENVVVTLSGKEEVPPEGDTREALPHRAATTLPIGWVYEIRRETSEIFVDRCSLEGVAPSELKEAFTKLRRLSL